MAPASARPCNCIACSMQGFSGLKVGRRHVWEAQPQQALPDPCPAPQAGTLLHCNPYTSFSQASKDPE